MPDTDAPQPARQNVRFDDAGTTRYGYLAVPPGGTGPGVVLIQEWWGLTDHIAGIADKLAAEGFVVLAPDLYGGRTAHDPAEAQRMMTQIPVEEAARLLTAAVDFLLAHDAVRGSQVGAVGFCMGGGFVLLLATRAGERVAAAVAYYGVGPAVPETYRGLTASVLGHYGRHDHVYPVEQARALERQLVTESDAKTVTFHYYDAAHAFHNDANPHGNYQPQASALAWKRTVDFLREHLGA